MWHAVSRDCAGGVFDARLPQLDFAQDTLQQLFIILDDNIVDCE